MIKLKLTPVRIWYFLFFIFFTFAFGLLQWKQRFRLHPDEVSYLEIAQLYRNGNISQALNAYWNPLFSWLLIPVSYITIWPYTGKILNILLIGSLFTSVFLFSQYLFSNKFEALLTALFTILFPSEFLYAWLYTTPDLLLVNFTVWFLFCFFKLKANNPKNWFIFGILSGTGYLIKNAFLPISLIFFFLTFLTGQRKFNFRNGLCLLLGMILIPLIWGTLLFTKYNRFTMGTSAGVNYYQYVSENKAFNFFSKPAVYPVYGSSFWHDPSSFPKITFNTINQLKVIYQNTKVLFRTLLWNINFGWIFILILIFKLKKSATQKILIIFILSWYIVYVPVLVVPRYIWPTIPLLFILIVSTYNAHLKTLFLIYFLVILSMFISGYFRYLRADPVDKTSWEISNELKSPCVLLTDNWMKGLSVAYLSGCKYYGVSETARITQPNLTSLKSEIKSGSVTHFISFGDKKYQNIYFFSPVKSWPVNNQKITLYKYYD